MPTFKFVGFSFVQAEAEVKAAFKAADGANVEVSLKEDDMRSMLAGDATTTQGHFPKPELEKALSVIAA